MEKDKELAALVKLIRSYFPDASEKTDESMIRMGFEHEDEAYYYTWVEAFANETNSLMRERRQTEVEKHLIFFVRQFDMGSDSVKSCIDVSYVENLMWDLDIEDKKWAWLLFPENLKLLYIDMWDPDF
jgi:hypothetical protein